MRAFDRLVRQRRFVNLVVLLLAAAGIASALSLPSSIYPELKFQRITIVAQGTLLGARQQVFTVTIPLEGAVSTVPGVERVRSRSIRGASELSLYFTPKTEMTTALQQVESAINQIRADLPPELQIRAQRLLPSNFPILTYTVTGSNAARLFDIATYQIRPALAGIPGMGPVDVEGSAIPEVQVIVDPARLATTGLSYADVATAVGDALRVDVLGRIDQYSQQYLIIKERTATELEDVEEVVLRGAYHLGEVATVRLGTEDLVRIIRGDGRPAALINIARHPGGNTVTIADSARRVMAALQPTLPDGVRLKAVYDQAVLVREAVRSVWDAMAIGAALVVVILFLFLGNGRITAISALMIPITLAITIFIMKLLGATFNLMTLGGMAVAIGLVIDDGVVVTENIVRHLALTPDRHAAIREALAELVWPVTTSTLTTVVVLLPLRLLQGVVGQFFAALSTTLVIAVLISLFLALAWVPLLADRFVRPGTAAAEGGWRHILDHLTHVISRLGTAYSHTLDRALRHPKRFIALAILLVIAGVIAYRAVGTGFLPIIDEGAFVLDYRTPTGTSLAETDRELLIVERILAETPEITATARRTGAEMGLFATQQNEGDIVVRLRPRNRRGRNIFTVMDDVRRRVQQALPRLHIEFVQILTDLINDLAGNANPVEIKLFGSQLTELEGYAERLAPRIEKIAGVVDLSNGIVTESPEILMRVDAGAAGRLGLSPQDVATQIDAALLGTPAGQITSGERLVGIRVRAPNQVRFDPLRLGAIPIYGKGSATPTPLSALATFKDTASATELTREDQRQLIAITAGLDGRSLGAVMGDVRAAIAAEPPPAGVEVRLGGQYASQRQAFRSLLLVLVLAALLVVMVMLVQFQSFVEPLVILLAAPLSFAGALVLLLLTGTPLNVSSLMGLILLVGLVVKNGIILLDFTRRRMRFEGKPLGSAIREAGGVRLRPILMTTFATLFGLLPLALGIGAGSESQRPLALAVIGGLALSTPITLFLVPALIVAIRGREWRL